MMTKKMKIKNEWKTMFFVFGLYRFTFQEASWTEKFKVIFSIIKVWFLSAVTRIIRFSFAGAVKGCFKTRRSRFCCWTSLEGRKRIKINFQSSTLLTVCCDHLTNDCILQARCNHLLHHRTYLKCSLSIDLFPVATSTTRSRSFTWTL